MSREERYESGPEVARRLLLGGACETLYVQVPFAPRFNLEDELLEVLLKEVLERRHNVLELRVVLDLGHGNSNAEPRSSNAGMNENLHLLENERKR